MLKNTIKFSDETKSLIDEIKLKFDLKTYDATIKTAILFISRNEINLKDDYIGDYRKGLVDLENRMFSKFKEHQDKLISDNKSLRNFIGAIEKDYLKPLTEKIGTLDKINDLGINKILEDKQNVIKNDNPLNSHLKTENVQPQINEVSKVEDSKNDEKLREIYRLYEMQKQTLFKIFNNSKVESGGMMSKEKIIINLSAEEWEELKNQG